MAKAVERSGWGCIAAAQHCASERNKDIHVNIYIYMYVCVYRQGYSSWENLMDTFLQFRGEPGLIKRENT